MLIQSKTRLLACGVARALGTSARVCASHYDVLGVTQRSSQGDIKTAYYKLSKIYHPDKSTDEESDKKFRAISEAYEVLGNIKLKKMYDKGLLTGKINTTHVEYEPDPEPTDPTLKFYKSHATRHVAPTMDGRTPIYDFDAWSRNHYGNVFQRSRYEKEFLRKKLEKRQEIINADRQEGFIYILFALGGLFIALVMHGTTDYDLDHTRKKRLSATENESKK